MRPRPTLARVVLLGCLMAASSAFASQVLLLDTTYTHTSDNRGVGLGIQESLKGSHAQFAFTPQQPSNWVTPDNYRDGKLYMLVDVFSKPSTLMMHVAACFIQSSYTCDGSIAFDKPGSYITSSSPPTGYQFSQVDWTRKFNSITIIMRDPNNKKIDLGQGFLDEPDYSKLTPMTLRVRIYAVSVGSTWVPPVAPDAGTVTPDAGHDAGSFVDAGRPDAGRPDAGPVDAGAIDSGSPGGPEDAGPPDAGEVEDAGSTTGEPLDAGSMMTHVDPPDPMEPGGVTLGGCSSSMAGAAIAFSLLLPALRRRRRTR